MKHFISLAVAHLSDGALYALGGFMVLEVLMHTLQSERSQ